MLLYSAANASVSLTSSTLSVSEDDGGMAVCVVLSLLPFTIPGVNITVTLTSTQGKGWKEGKLFLIE